MNSYPSGEVGPFFVDGSHHNLGHLVPLAWCARELTRNRGGLLTDCVLESSFFKRPWRLSNDDQQCDQMLTAGSYICKEKQKFLVLYGSTQTSLGMGCTAGEEHDSFPRPLCELVGYRHIQLNLISLVPLIAAWHLLPDQIHLDSY